MWSLQAPAQPARPTVQAAVPARRINDIQDRIVDIGCSVEFIHRQLVGNDEALIKLGFNIPADRMNSGHEMTEEVQSHRALQSDLQLRMNVMFANISTAHNELSSIRAAEESKKWSEQVQHDIWGEIRSLRQEMREGLGEVTALRAKVNSLQMDVFHLREDVCTTKLPYQDEE